MDYRPHSVFLGACATKATIHANSQKFATYKATQNDGFNKCAPSLELLAHRGNEGHISIVIVEHGVAFCCFHGLRFVLGGV